jgi:Holliday junction resolvase RusA-like endonuclease
VIVIELTQDPHPAPRPRASGRGVFMPRWYMALKTAWAWEARAQLAAGGWTPLCDGQRVAVAVTFRRATRAKCDLDNALKSFCDAMNGVLWNDDAQIDEAHVRVLRGVGKAACGVTAAVWECGPARPVYRPIDPASWVGV